MAEEQNLATPRRPPSRGSSVTRPAQARRGTPNKQESNFFGLPREIRDSIYRRVLYVSHPLYLFQDTGSQVETFAPDRPHRWLALLQVNRQIHVEAAETLFGVNHFALLDEKRPKDDLLEAFLTCIGAANSASLSHLSVDFPGLECSAEGLKIKDDSLKRLKLLQEFCDNLKTLEISFSVKHVRELDQVTGESQQRANEALSQINSQLRAISSLNTIIVRVTGPKPALSAMDCMRTLGWTILPAYGNH